MGEGLFVGGSRGDFLNLAGLIFSDRTNPRILAAFVAYFNCAADFAVDLLESGYGFQLQMLMAVDNVSHNKSVPNGTESASITSLGRFLYT